jgi:hypothetical protein
MQLGHDPNGVAPEPPHTGHVPEIVPFPSHFGQDTVFVPAQSVQLLMIVSPSLLIEKI